MRGKGQAEHGNHPKRVPRVGIREGKNPEGKKLLKIYKRADEEDGTGYTKGLGEGGGGV